MGWPLERVVLQNTAKKKGPKGAQVIHRWALIRQQQQFWGQEHPWHTSRRSS